jgi:hypothetical protein
MRGWRRQVRFGIIAVAGFVLLVTVLPQVASGIGLGSLANRLDSAAACSGSSGSSGGSGSGSSGGSCCTGSSDSGGSGSGSGSSQCNTGPGTVTGNVVVSGAPKSFFPSAIGAGACASTGTITTLCADPIFALQSDGTYSLSLDPGDWVVYGFYENSLFGGAFLSKPQVVTVTSGGTVVVNAVVPFAKPATLKATVTVTGLPAGVPLQSVGVLLCPAGSPFSGGIQPLTCVNGNGDYFPPPGPTSDSVVVTGLPSGPWTAYPSYCTVLGCSTNAAAGAPVNLVAGKTSRLKLKTSFLTPLNGLVNTTVTVSGAPAGFDASVGVFACQIQLGGSSCEGSSGSPSGSAFPLVLGAGLWAITGQYFAPVYGNAIDGSTVFILVQGGGVQSVALDVPYQVLGTAAGSIKVTGVPSGVKVTAYSVTACPTGGSPLDPFGFLSCVTEYSGSGTQFFGPANTRRLGRSAHRVALPHTAGTRINTYTLPTLTAGAWSLSVDYTTAFGTFSSPGSTTVNVTAAKTTTTHLTVPYQSPSTGVVTGSVKVVGVPANSFSASVQACSTQPTVGTCTDEIDAFLDANGKYALNLPAGTWWVSGVVYVYNFPSTEVLTSAPRQFSVTAGTRNKANFTVLGG